MRANLPGYATDSVMVESPVSSRNAPSDEKKSTSIDVESIALRPFLRWAGGKQIILRQILERIGERALLSNYFEPFAGAASVFLAIAPKRAVLADANPHLIACYKAVRDAPASVSRALAELKRSHGKRHYYRVREQYNNGGSPHWQAARFIYLNRTCFNGIFRVNEEGKFNVPIGDKANPIFPTPAELANYARALKKASLKVGSFEHTLLDAGKGAFVYLDPPYPPLNGTSFFTHYTRDRFGIEDQKRLSETVSAMHKRGARFLMTNADTPMIRDLYRHFDLATIDATRFVSCKNVKRRVSELIITNY
jgi:DNA adenine methylase